MHSRRSPNWGPGATITETMNATQPSAPSLPMTAKSRQKPLTFGDFVAGSYHVWGKRRAMGIIRLALKSHLIEFRGQQRIVISWRWPGQPGRNNPLNQWTRYSKQSLRLWWSWRRNVPSSKRLLRRFFVIPPASGTAGTSFRPKYRKRFATRRCIATGVWTNEESKRCNMMRNSDARLGRCVQDDPNGLAGGIIICEPIANNSTQGVDGYRDSRSIQLKPARETMPLARFPSKTFQSLFNRLCPIGYQDDEGFHYGKQKGPRRERWLGRQDSDGN